LAESTTEPSFSNVSYPVPSGKLRRYVTRKLREDTPEEHVRQRWTRSLIEEYVYPKFNLRIEMKINIVRARKRADLMVFKNGAEHTIRRGSDRGETR